MNTTPEEKDTALIKIQKYLSELKGKPSIPPPDFLFDLVPLHIKEEYRKYRMAYDSYLSKIICLASYCDTNHKFIDSRIFGKQKKKKEGFVLPGVKEVLPYSQPFERR